MQRTNSCPLPWVLLWGTHVVCKFLPGTFLFCIAFPFFIYLRSFVFLLDIYLYRWRGNKKLRAQNAKTATVEIPTPP